ncbi:hypothetical protein AMS68_001234 [Peltaster fructicola]|uniref:DUF1996 domain-containing protein n=1 Tax=Peltaster fructicola TaxID=286661 RepID=A0A6H0XLT7_9PEZI|nr:hypothetical protein AMS68_001234 [Peltaster fructicola]
MVLVNTILLAATIVGFVSASNVWTVNCAPLTVQRSDPIKNPGAAAGHVHAVVGSTAFSRSMGADTAKDGLLTTCDKFTDHSNYWAPQLYNMRSDGKFELMPFTGMNAYYTDYTCNYDPSGHCPQNRNPAAFPEGLRMIAGNSERRTFNKSDPWQAAILMESGNDGEQYGMPKTLGDRISGHVRFPSCWDGVNLDSADHQSHVSYPDPALGGDTQGGMCPKSHPHAMINIGAEFGWSTKGVSSPNTLVWAQGDTTGYGFHGDFMMGWMDPSALQQSFVNCIDNNNCPWRSFGSPTGKAPNPTTLLPQIPAPVEDVGLLAPLSALPGNNKVYKQLTIKGRKPVPDA